MRPELESTDPGKGIGEILGPEPAAEAGEGPDSPESQALAARPCLSLAVRLVPLTARLQPPCPPPFEKGAGLASLLSGCLSVCLSVGRLFSLPVPQCPWGEPSPQGYGENETHRDR